MASPAELEKLIANMKRGTALVDRAVQSVDKDAQTMDRFEQRLAVKDGFMAKVADYEKQMAAMDAIGNGGPPLDSATFQSSAAKPPAIPADAGVTAEHPTVPVIRHDTGDPVR